MKSPVLSITLMLGLSFCARNGAYAETMAGPSWKTVQFETIDGETVKIDSKKTAVSVTVSLANCQGKLRDIPVIGLPVLNRVDFFYDQEENERTYVLNIPIIKQEGQKQAHATASISIIKCALKQVEFEDDSP